MRKPLLITGILCLILADTLHAQITLNWGASFLPTWSNGALSRTATNINGNSISCTTAISMSGSGNFTGVTGNGLGTQTPTVSGALFMVPGSSNRVHITPNYNSNSSYTDIVYSFTSLVTNVNFRIADIDKNDPNSTSYFDRVTITGTNGTTSFNPTITRYDASTDPNFLVISGNTASVNTSSGQADNTASDATDQRGTINVSFGSSVINSITIRYDNAPGANNNPAAQAIAIGNLSFNQSTLPVTLMHFSGNRQSEDVQLQWSTSQEFNSSHFDIERNSGNGWSTIGTITAAGNSQSVKQYSYRDSRPSGTILLYRLRQADIDNRSVYSSVVRINIDQKTGELLVYPNPVKSNASISFYQPVSQQMSIELTDMAGRLLLRETRQAAAGNNNFTLSLPVLIPRGTYQLTLKDPSGQITGTKKILREE